MAVQHEAIAGRLNAYKIPPQEIKFEEGWNPRSDFGDLKSLAEDIKANGVLNFLKVRKGEGDQLFLVDGERRLRAVQMLLDQGVDIPWVPCTFVEGKLSEAERFYIAMSSNTGKPLTIIEQGRAYQRLRNWGVPLAEISRRTGTPKTTVAQRLALVDAASPAVLKALDTGKINLAMALEVVQESKTTDEQHERLASVMATAPEPKLNSAGKPQKMRRKSGDMRKKRESEMLPLEYAEDFIKQAKQHLRTARRA